MIHSGPYSHPVTTTPARTSVPGALRRYPLTIGYTALLVVTGVGLSVVPPDAAARFERAISTNLDNLTTHPIRVLFLSVVAAAPGYRWLYVGLIALILGVCEQWLGTWRTLATYLAGNVVTTLLVAIWIEHALDIGLYDASIRSTSDFGVSYGLNTLVFTLVARPPRLWQSLLLGVGALGWLFLEGPWQFRMQDEYFGLGHIIASALGLALAGVILVRRAMSHR